MAGEEGGGGGGRGGYINFHSREAEQTKDQNRIQNNVDNGSGSLGDHGIKGLARCLQHPFKHDLNKNTKGRTTADRQILLSILHDFFNICLASEKRL